MAVWQKGVLQNFITFQRGFDITKKEVREGNYQVISSSGPAYCHSEYKVKGPGVVIGRKGTLGSYHYTDQDFWPHDTTLWVKDFHGNIPKFVYYFVQTMKFEQYDSGAANPTLNRNHIHSLPVRFPSVDLQVKVVNYLSSYDNLIENNNRRIAILEEMAQSLYREWFVKFRFPGHEQSQMVDSPLGLIPEEWKANVLTNFGTVITGKTPSKKKPEYFGSDIPFIKTPDMHAGMFVTHTTEELSREGGESQKKKYLPPNSLSVSCIGTAGVVAINAERAQTNQQINSIVLLSQKLREFLYFALLDLKPTIERYGATGATMTNLSKGKFEALLVNTPPENLLERYSTLMKPAFDQILNLTRKNNCLKAQRDLLLPKLISGQIDLSQAEQAIA